MSFVYSVMFIVSVAAFAFWGPIHVKLAARLTRSILNKLGADNSLKGITAAIKRLKNTVIKGLTGSLFAIMAAIEFNFAANNPEVAFGSYLLRAEVASVVGGLLAIVTTLAIIKLTLIGFCRYCKMEGILGGRHYRKSSEFHRQR